MLALPTLLHYLSIDFYRVLQVIYLRKFNSSLAHQMSLFVLFGNLNKCLNVVNAFISKGLQIISSTE